jgi:hypothetical protein
MVINHSGCVVPGKDDKPLGRSHLEGARQAVVEVLSTSSAKLGGTESHEVIVNLLGKVDRGFAEVHWSS